jgi:outer membrane beta-barrel protein
MKKVLIVAAVAVTVAMISFFSLEAAAEENEKISVLQLRAFSQKGKHELTPFFAVSMNDKYTSHLGGGAQYAYHALEILGIQATGMYLYGFDSSLTNELYKKQAAPVEPDRTMMTYYAGADLLLYPLYGKLNLFGAASVNFNIFILGGAGVLGTKVYNITDKKYKSVDAARFGGSVGGGLQFFALNWLNVKFEFRDIIFSASGKDNSGQPVSAVLNNAMFMLGVGFML